MKRIILCVVLAIICLVVGAFSFLVNDLPSYHRWMADNGPRIMENFGYRNNKDRDKKEFSKDSPDKNSVPMPRREDNHDNFHGGPMNGNSHMGPMMGPSGNSGNQSQESQSSGN